MQEVLDPKSFSFETNKQNQQSTLDVTGMGLIQSCSKYFLKGQTLFPFIFF